MGTPTDVADPSPAVVSPVANAAKQYVRRAAAAQPALYRTLELSDDDADA